MKKCQITSCSNNCFSHASIPVIVLQRLLTYLLAGKTITGIEALEKFGIYRLSDCIHVFRNKGYNIKTTLRNNADGDGQHAVYKWIRE